MVPLIIIPSTPPRLVHQAHTMLASTKLQRPGLMRAAAPKALPKLAPLRAGAAVPARMTPSQVRGTCRGRPRNDQGPPTFRAGR